MSFAGTSGGHLNNILLNGFRITSATSMTAGNALHLTYVDYSALNDIIIDSNVIGNHNIYDGVFFESSSLNSYIGFNVYTSHYGIKADNGVELNLDNGQLLGNGDTAIYLGGGFGGLYTGYVSIFGGEVGIRVDTDLTGTANNQIFVSNRTVIDNANSAGVYLADNITSNKSFTFQGWSSSCIQISCNAFVILNWANGNINIGGAAQMLSNAGNAIYYGDSSVNLTIATSTAWNGNGAYGVYCSVATTKIISDAQGIGTGNAAGDYSSNCGGQLLRARWPSYTPSIGCAGGGTPPTLASIAGYYKTIGKTTDVEINATFNSTGTCANAVTFTLPNNSALSGVIFGREYASTGSSLSGQLVAASNIVSVTKYDNTTLQTSGYAYSLTGRYENQ